MPEKNLGYVTIRIPIGVASEQESWEIPELYEYLFAGEAVIVAHDIPEHYRELLTQTWGEMTMDATMTEAILRETYLPTFAELEVVS